ncbi:MAG: carboxypeptidase-like regulatory domain-containing protein [Longimicrobiales bacterium]|nr:carboxypeptidase-like regulatory domain-containing protein [Longimicrobiales bacterium]
MINYASFRTLSTLALAVALAPATPLRAQIQGRIVDASLGTVIPSASVTLLDIDGDTLNTVTATLQGEFFLGWTGGPGSYFLRIGALGYDGTTRPIEYEGEPILVHVTVSPAPVDIQGIEVGVEQRSIWLERNGFYDRRRTMHGEYLVVDDKIRSTISRSAHIFRDFPGMRVEQGREPYFSRGQRGGQGRCYPMVVVDNIPMRRDQPAERGFGSVETFDALVPRPMLIAAVEAYNTTSAAPPQWVTNLNNCGVIAIWTTRKR